MHQSRLALQPFRRKRREAVRQYVGNNWSDAGADKSVPVNLLARYVQIMSRSLIAANPRIVLSTFEREHKPAVKAMQAWANREIERMDLADTIGRAVIDAFFSIGIVKVGFATVADAATEAWGVMAGEPFAEVVSPDDFVFDHHARSFKEVSFMGHRYRMPLRAAEAMFGKKVSKGLTPSTDSPFDHDGEEKVAAMGAGTDAVQDEEFEDMVSIWEVYLPRQRLCVTLRDDDLHGAVAEGGDRGYYEPLKVENWIGPDGGPYHIFGFDIAPDNAMPKAPIQDLLDLHEAHNRALRKVIRTSERTKELMLVTGGAGSTDGERIRDANDGDGVRVESTERVKPVTFGGLHLQAVMAVAMATKDLFNSQGGNLEILSGSGPQSDTATQDKMINANASAGVAKMQELTIKQTASVCKALCWYWWRDPHKVMRVSHALPGLPEMERTREVHPASKPDQPKDRKLRRDGLPPDLVIDVFSLQAKTPQSRLAFINQFVTQVVIPLLPLWQQSGIGFNANAYLQMISELGAEPRITDLLTVQEPPTPETATGGSHERTLAGQTERTYTRENVAQRTQRGNDQQMVQAMAGAGGPQQQGSY